MATVPTFEKLLLEVHQSLGLESGMATKAKDKYQNFDNEIKAFEEKTKALLKNISDALDMDEQAHEDVFFDLFEWIGFHEELNQHIYTGNASAQQVTWQLLIRSYIPGVARRLAFWSVAGMSMGIPMDSGMPGRDFWFLPTIDEKSGKVRMPVAKVCDWLLELLSANLSEQQLGRNDGVQRTLQNWLSGNSTPQSAKKIDEIFPETSQLEFKGTLEISTELPLSEKLRIALEFIKNKTMTSESLHAQLPMTVERLNAVLDGTAPQSEQEAFVHWLTLRYAKPNILTIRQRFKVARMVQDGCQRLLKFLAPADLHDETYQSRLLKQMLVLFHMVYNLTVQASQEANTEEEQDTWFESKLTLNP